MGPHLEHSNCLQVSPSVVSISRQGLLEPNEMQKNCGVQSTSLSKHSEFEHGGVTSGDF